MLTSLHIENYALIRESDIHFAGGFVAITGETGAGKSILLGALTLLLGGRADCAVLADKNRKCVVEAVFDIRELALAPQLADSDIDIDEDGLLILRREILPTGRSRAFANDSPVPLRFLADMASRLVDIHSQNQNTQLADALFRLGLLDSLSDATISARYREAYEHYSTLKHELERLTAEEAESRREQDYLQFQYDELAEAHLVTDEQSALEQEQQLLEHAESIREGLYEAAALLDGDENQSVLVRLRDAKNALMHIASFLPVADALLQRLNSSLIELDDINSELQHQSSQVSYDPARQQEVDERLALLYRLEKKHGVDDEEALIALRDDLDRRLQGIATQGERIQALMEEVDKAYTTMQSEAATLTEARQQAAATLSEGILPTLHALGMPEARFRVTITPAASYTPEGHDNASFLFTANRGGEMSDMARVASGGEMSRLMLAVKSMVNSRRLIPTVIFDEIDTGVSGDISVSVADTMCHMAATMQVVAITHLPQIAARANQHLKVYKEVEDDSTVSRLRELCTDERVTEIAVMLSSDPPTPAALQTARELMKL